MRAKQRGTRLGLVSVKSIVKAHGGKITVSNSHTIFKIKIPKIRENNFSSYNEWNIAIYFRYSLLL